ncbi:MAG: hypothetical protein E6Q97_08540 [Desulfurellales bacterium]|nr:MAG: hypothetical protein E6Q97_08540 [Desulfurellales bacterium]
MRILYEVYGYRTATYDAAGERMRFGKIERAPAGPRPCRAAPLPAPTLALPGSEEKIAVLADRARKGLALHHPRDAGWAEAGMRVGMVGVQVEEDDDE